MNKTIEAHKALLKSNSSASEESRQQFIDQFHLLTENAINNGFSYIINLNTLNYEYVSEFCYYLTGRTNDEFLSIGMDILPKIMVLEDFQKLSLDIFPEMESAFQTVDDKDKSAVMFELYYRYKGIDGKPDVSAVEYSSYSEFDSNGSPTISTGFCYESPLQINGVRGIVRVKTVNGQETIYDRMVLHDLETLTTTERKLAELLAKGRSHKNIAKEMNVSIHTVKTHFKNIYKKLNINRASELINYLNTN